MRLRLLILLILCGNSALGLEWEGECVRVSDGDTLTVMYYDLPVKIRLYGVDAPERGQDFGRVATRHVASLAHGRRVRVESVTTDSFNRVVALVYADGVCLNESLLAAGLAWVYEKYCESPHRESWSLLEAAARQAGAGLWSHPDPVPPWEKRRRRK